MPVAACFDSARKWFMNEMLAVLVYWWMCESYIGTWCACDCVCVRVCRRLPHSHWTKLHTVAHRIRQKENLKWATCCVCICIYIKFVCLSICLSDCEYVFWIGLYGLCTICILYLCPCGWRVYIIYIYLFIFIATTQDSSVRLFICLLVRTFSIALRLVYYTYIHTYVSCCFALYPLHGPHWHASCARHIVRFKSTKKERSR